MRQIYNSEKELNSLDTILFSIVHSFVIVLIYQVVELVFAAPQEDNDASEILRNVILIILSIVYSYIIIKLPKSEFGKCIGKLFNKNLTSENSVWSKAMENENGAWATVYLKNGLVYIGMLRYYTSNPNESIKEIYLSNFKSAIQTGSPDKSVEDISNNENNPKAVVLLDKSEIISIEILKE
jgi:hypothetical protein